jgi:hypothetical protein
MVNLAMKAVKLTAVDLIHEKVGPTFAFPASAEPYRRVRDLACLRWVFSSDIDRSTAVTAAVVGPNETNGSRFAGLQREDRRSGGLRLVEAEGHV